MEDLFLLEMFIVLVCIWQLQMSRAEDKSDRTKTILMFAGLIVAIIAILVQLYINSPSGFVVKVYPDTQLDVCLENNTLRLDRNVGIIPGYSWENPSNRGIFIKELYLHIDKDTIGFVENVSITDIDGPKWALGHVIKPYGKQVTLVVEKMPLGVDIAFANESFSAQIQENSRVVGIPPFDAQIILKIARNARLTPGPYYITIKGIGANDEIETCNCVLMVNRFCKYGFIGIGL